MDFFGRALGWDRWQQIDFKQIFRFYLQTAINFILQDDQIGHFRQPNKTLHFYLKADVYFTGKVKTFRLFLRFENVNNLFQNEVAYQVANYPQFDFKMRFGVSWLLLN